MMLLLKIGLLNGITGGVLRLAKLVRLKSGLPGQIRKPLSFTFTTIQEKRLLGNRISSRETGPFSGIDGIKRNACNPFRMTF
jgi:hypothetical protein